MKNKCDHVPEINVRNSQTVVGLRVPKPAKSGCLAEKLAVLSILKPRRNKDQ